MQTVLLLWAAIGAGAEKAPKQVDFARDVRPILYPVTFWPSAIFLSTHAFWTA